MKINKRKKKCRKKEISNNNNNKYILKKKKKRQNEILNWHNDYNNSFLKTNTTIHDRENKNWIEKHKKKTRNGMNFEILHIFIVYKLQLNGKY